MTENPKISIITPSYNQAHYIERTIKSVMTQNFSNFEHIIVDAGSTDGTMDILKKYQHLKWISEKDDGQGDAINKGFSLASGDIYAWLNSDDYYDDNIFQLIVNAFCNENCDFLYGDITYVDESESNLGKRSGDKISYKKLLKDPDIIRQPSTFWTKELWDKVAPIDISLNVVMDLDLFLRMTKIAKIYYLPFNLSFFRYYKSNKTLSLSRQQVKEIIKVISRHKKCFHPFTYKLLVTRYLKSFFI